MTRHDEPPGDPDGYRSSWTQGGDPPPRHGYGQRSGGSAGSSGRHALGTGTERAGPRVTQEGPGDSDYRRWREEQARGMDADYASWRRERFSKEFAQWRAIRIAQAGLRTGSGPPITHADRERELRGTAGDAADDVDTHEPQR